jgi:hypothetical protein
VARRHAQPTEAGSGQETTGKAGQKQRIL